jgi:hypothetical protein
LRSPRAPLVLVLAAGLLAASACDPTVRAGTSVRQPGADAPPAVNPDGAIDARDGGAAAETTTARDAQDARDIGGPPDTGLAVAEPLTLDDPVPVPGRSQADPAIGFDGERYLVVFTDQRAGRPDWSAFEGQLDVYGARVRADGTVLDQGGFPIITGFGDQHTPGIGFDGTNYLLVYLDYIPNPGFDDDVMGIRLDRDGKPIDPAPFAISTSPASFSGPPAVVFNGTDFLVGWAGSSGPFVRRIGTDGVPKGDPLPLSDPAGSPIGGTDISIATDGDGFLVVSGPGARLVTAQGTAPSPAFPLAATGDSADPARVSYGGGMYLAAWSGLDVDSRWVNATRVTTAGAVLDSPAKQLGVIAHQIGVVDTPLLGGVSYDPVKGYFDLFWVSNNHIGRALVTPGGATSDGFGAGDDAADVGATRDAPSINFHDGQFFLAWRSSYPDDTPGIDLRSGLFGHLLTSDFNFGPTFSLVETANEQLWPAVGSNGDGFLVAWSDTRNQETGSIYLGKVTDVYGARLDAGGHVLDPAGIVIARAPSDQALPAVASDGDRYLVVWTDGRAGATPGHIYGTFVTRDGTVTDPAGFQISDDASGAIQILPSVAWNGSSYLVVWEARPYLYGAGPARAVLVSPQGEVMGPRTGFVVCDGCFNPKVAATADGTFLVVGSQQTSNYNPTVATRVSSAGVVLDPAGIVLDPLTANDRGVAVASDGNEFLAVWAGSLGMGADFRAAARISTGGEVLSTISLPLAYAFRPSATFDGNQYLVAWQESRYETSSDASGRSRDGADDNVMGLHVSRSGEVIEPAPFAIAATSVDEVWPALASNRNGTTIAAYTWPRLDPGYGSRRTGARIVTPSAP